MFFKSLKTDYGLLTVRDFFLFFFLQTLFLTLLLTIWSSSKSLHLNFREFFWGTITVRKLSLIAQWSVTSADPVVVFADSCWLLRTYSRPPKSALLLAAKQDLKTYSLLCCSSRPFVVFSVNQPLLEWLIISLSTAWVSSLTPLLPWWSGGEVKNYMLLLLLEVWNQT